MAISWQDARNKVRGDLWRPGTSGVPDDVCDRALHASLLMIEAERRWLWLENIRHSAQLPEATNRITLPSDLRSVTALTFQRASGTYDPPLAVLPVEVVRERASYQARGWPTAFALSGGDAFLDATVRADTGFDLVYSAKTPDEVADAVGATTPNVTLQKQQAIVITGACAQVALTYLRNNDEAARQSTAFQRGLDRLHDVEDDARGGGLIVPDDGYACAAGFYQ